MQKRHMRSVFAGGRIVLAALVCVLLAGCFASTQPKFPAASAVPALGEGGRFEYYERDPSGAFARRQTYQVVRHRYDAAYDVFNQSADLTPVSLHGVGNGLVVMQSKSGGDTPPYSYSLFRLTDEGALVYIPSCKRQDRAKLAPLGVEFRGDKCVIDKVADVGALFASLELGEPTGKIVRIAPGTPTTP